MSEHDFAKLIAKEAYLYACDMVEDPENQRKTIESIVEDFTEGAWAAYSILTE